MSQALIVIDVQRALFQASPAPYEAVAVLARINALMARARARGLPVVLVQHASSGGRLQRGSDGWELDPRLELAASDQVLHKTSPDSFLRTDLEALLHSQDVQQLVVCGYASEFCVDTTVRRAAGLGFGVILVEDAHTTHDKVHASAAQIRAHVNATLPELTSFGPRIQTQKAQALWSE